MEQKGIFNLKCCYVKYFYIYNIEGQFNPDKRKKIKRLFESLESLDGRHYTKSGKNDFPVDIFRAEPPFSQGTTKSLRRVISIS